LVEVFVHDFTGRETRHMAADLHHPTWRPDGRAILFVRREARSNNQTLWEVDVQTGKEVCVFDKHVPAGHPSYQPRKPHVVMTDCYGGEFGYGLCYVNLKTQEIAQLVTVPLGSRPEPPADTRFPFRNYHIWIPPRAYLNEPRPVWNADGSKVFYTSQESGRFNLYVADTSDL
jgi:hypothetical protein